MAGAETVRPRAVVCLSGGMDSCVCAALAARDYEVYAVHFSYGQRTEARELRSAEEIARLTGVRELLPLKIDLFRRIGGSALTDSTISGNDGTISDGGGVRNTTGTLTILNSTISGNNAANGGGLANFGTLLTVKNSCRAYAVP